MFALGFLALFYAVGHAVPGLGMFGTVLTRGPSRRREVALCFVAREGLVELMPVLRALEVEQVTAAFFFSRAALEVADLEPVFARGHIVGLASSERGALTWLTVPALRRELKNGAALLVERFEHRAKWFVPPRRGFGAALFATARRIGASAVLPRRYGVDEDVPNGALIELPLDDPEAAAVCSQCLQTLKAKNLKVVALSRFE